MNSVNRPVVALVVVALMATCAAFHVLRFWPVLLLERPLASPLWVASVVNGGAVVPVEVGEVIVLEGYVECAEDCRSIATSLGAVDYGVWDWPVQETWTEEADECPHGTLWLYVEREGCGPRLYLRECGDVLYYYYYYIWCPPGA